MLAGYDLDEGAELTIHAIRVPTFRFFDCRDARALDPTELAGCIRLIVP